MNKNRQVKPYSILVDTGYLINLSDYKNRDNGQVALSYQEYFINNQFNLLLSSIVVAEFHQRQDIKDILKLKVFKALPYNINDAVATASILEQYPRGKANNIRSSATSRAEFKDDYKIIGQAENNKVDFIITNDVSTMARYATNLNELGIISTKVIKLKDGFRESYFNNGQEALMPVD